MSRRVSMPLWMAVVLFGNVALGLPSSIAYLIEMLS
jgi:hypothetical protein